MSTQTFSGALPILLALPLAYCLPDGTAETPPVRAADGSFDAGAWAEVLRREDLEQRRAGYEELLEAARRDAEILQRVREWADRATDVELAWTAQLMLREIEPMPPSVLRHHPAPPGGRWSPFGRDPFDTRWIDEMLEGLGQGPLFARPGIDPFAQPGQAPRRPHGSSSRESSRFSMGPDGVRLEVEETIDGETTTRTYEAETLEELLETYPELEGEVDLGGSLPGIGLRPLEKNSGWPFAGPSHLDRGLRPLRPSLDALGIRVVEPANRSLDYPGVDRDVGLQVVGVVPGSLAEAIGVRPGELVVAIGGRAIASAADVQEALASQSLEREIEVECVDPDGTRKLRRWTPPDADTTERGDLGRRLGAGATRI